MRRSLAYIALCLVAAADLSRASAQATGTTREPGSDNSHISVVVLPPVGHLDLPADVLARVGRTVTDTLRAQRVSIVEWSAAQASLPRALANCTGGVCLGQVIRTLHVDFAVTSGVWREGLTTFVETRFVTADRNFVGRNDLGNDIDAAARASCASALERAILGDGPWLVLRGAPTGARIELDGGTAGSLPLSTRITPGLHHVRISATGHETVNIPVLVANDVESWARVEVELRSPEALALMHTEDSETPHPARAPLAPPVDEINPSNTSAWNYIIGSALGAGAIAIGTLVAVGLSSSNCSGDTCQDAEFGLTSALGVATAGVFALGSAGFFVFRPIETAP